jgi:hypothetical protein
MLRHQGDNTLIIYQSCHATNKLTGSINDYLAPVLFENMIWLSPSWILPSAAKAFPASLTKKIVMSRKMRWQSLSHVPSLKMTSLCKTIVVSYVDTNAKVTNFWWERTGDGGGHGDDGGGNVLMWGGGRGTTRLEGGAGDSKRRCRYGGRRRWTMGGIFPRRRRDGDGCGNAAVPSDRQQRRLRRGPKKH